MMTKIKREMTVFSTHLTLQVKNLKLPTENRNGLQCCIRRPKCRSDLSRVISQKNKVVLVRVESDNVKKIIEVLNIIIQRK